MDIFFSLLIRLIVWISGFARLLSRLGLCQYEEWSPGKPVKILLVGYNGARNTGADATILPQAFGLPPILTIMALAKRIAKIILD